MTKPEKRYVDDYGTIEWRLSILHREDGPAVEYANGTKIWYLNGDRLTEEEFNERMKND